jgi:hypothetical protein
MKIFFLVLLSAALLALAGFFAFGFLATFEPNPPMRQWSWRIVHGLGIAGALWGLVRIWLTAFRAPSGDARDGEP